MISGTFEISLTPAESHAAGKDGVTLARQLIHKTYDGPLSGTGMGEMLSAMTPVQGSAGYVAMEQITGTLDGRKGAFVLQHFALMDRGSPRQDLVVVPDSGTGELTGLTGSMTIRIENGQHFYDFEFLITDGASAI